MIEAKSISKSFGNIKAVDKLSFKIDTGEVVGLLGPNGAGKSTTMRMLSGLFYPDEGKVFIGGKNIEKDTQGCKSQIGYMAENNPLYKDSLVCEILDTVINIRGMKKADRKDAIEKVVEETAIGNVYYKPIRTLSKGYKQRVGLAQALIHDPEYLILDEPTEGLDPNQRNDIRKLIKEIAKDKTILISTHVMQEVSAMCNRVIIINNGMMVADDTPENLERGITGDNTIELTIEGNDIGSELKTSSHIKKVESKSGRARRKEFLIHFDGKEEIYKDIALLSRKNKWIIYRLSQKSVNLEEIFYKLTK